MSGERRILMMINFFPPVAGGGVYRPLSFVKHLSRTSWKVTVVTPEAGGFWITDPDLEKAVPPEVRVSRTRSLSGQHLLSSMRRGGGASRRSSSGFGLLRRLSETFMLPDSYAGWIPFAAKEARRLCESGDFDVLYSTSPPDSTHIAARRVALGTGIPWVADFRDPWINLYLRKPPTPLHRAVHRRMEASVVKAATVLVTTDWQREELMARYPWARVEKIPNGYDEDDFDQAQEAAPPAGPFTISHCGMLTLGRGTGPFLEGLSRFLAAHPGEKGSIRVIFAGARESENERLARRPGLEGVVEFRDNMPHSETVALETRSHVLLLIKHDDPAYGGLVPGKLFEYVGARRPILALAPPGEAASIVLDNRRGEVAGPGSPEEIAAALEKMYGLYRSGGLDEAYSLESLPGMSRRAAAGRLAALLDSLAAGAKEQGGPE